jgi:hypothetical protein
VEKEYQLKAIENSGEDLNVSQCIFANELIQLYELFTRAAQDQEIKFGNDIMRSLPKSRRQYLEEINFEEFETMPIMLKKELRQPDEKTIKQARLRGLNLQEIGY